MFNGVIFKHVLHGTYLWRCPRDSTSSPTRAAGEVEQATYQLSTRLLRAVFPLSCLNKVELSAQRSSLWAG